MSKSVVLALITTISSILLLLFACDNSNTYKQEFYEGNFLAPEKISEIQDGDIIMRQGYGIVSSIILRSLDEDIPVSHIGIIVQDSIGQLHVIHSVSRAISDYDGIQVDDLERFVNQSRPNSVIITRYNNQTQDYNGNKISERANHYLERKVPFDHSFNLQDSTAFFCSELIWRILIEVYDDDVFELYPTDNFLEKLKFSPFIDPQRFDIIVNQHDSK